MHAHSVMIMNWRHHFEKTARFRVYYSGLANLTINLAINR